MATVEKSRSEVRAVAKYVRTAPRKAALVADQIRGRTVPEARTILAFMTRDAARDVEKVLTSAVANAEANHGLVGDDLLVSTVFVGDGPTLKRWRARARGRVGRIRKRTCHITVALALPGEAKIPAPVAAVAAPAEAPKPKRAPRAKPAAPAETAETAETAEAQPEEAPVAATVAPPADAPAEEPRPKRAPRKKPEAPTSEEAPKPKRAPRKKAAEKPADEAADKPKRAPRRKKTDEESES